MQKTLVQFFGAAVMVWGALLGFATSARAQSVGFVISAAPPLNGPARQSLPQVIHVTNAGGAEATNVSVTFTPPKGAKVDTACQVDHLAGGLRSYTCSVGNLAPGQTADVPFSISMLKTGDFNFGVDVNCDQPVSAGALFSITIF
jgi:hypothetical protein